MAAVTVTSACNTSISQSFNFENDNVIRHLRDISFSSFRSNDDDTFTLKLGESTRTISPISTPTLEPIYQIDTERKYSQGSEIDVFDAEKYFSKAMDDEKRPIHEIGMKIRFSQEERIDIIPPPTMAVIKSATPSILSEASWNSQTALLAKLQKDHSVHMRKQASGKSFFSSLGCNCSDSVDVDDNVAKNKTPIQSDKIINLRNLYQSIKILRKRKDSLAFPISNPVTVGGPLQPEEKERISLEVFGGPLFGKEDLGSTLERRLMRLSLDNGHRTDDIGGMDGGDDLGSESSSDLFEIRSLATVGHPSFNPDTCDDVSCYEPSEMSIQWSVDTASAANFSVASYDDRQLLTKKKSQEVAVVSMPTKNRAGKTGLVKDANRRQPGSLLGCRSDKAVKVAENACKISPKSDPLRRRRSDSVAPLARLQAAGATETETHVTNFDSPRVRGGFHARSLSRSRSARVSCPLFLL